MAFPPGFLDELRSRLSLAELVGRRVRLMRRGREYGGLCPFHNEKTPSFYVVEDKGFFHCFGCGAHGDAIGFVMRAENLDFIEAVERLAGEAGVAVPQQTPQERERAQRQKTLLDALAAAADFYEAQLWSRSGAAARDYLTARGLDEATIRRFRLGWAGDDRQALRRALSDAFPQALLREAGLLRVPDDGGAAYDYFRGRVMFPIGDRAGRVIAFGARTLGDDQPKYLNSPDTPVFEKGRVLYGWAAARAHLGRADNGAAPVIVVEGYMDVIALHRAGFGGAVAPLGTALTEMQLHELWRLSPEPVLCFDGDTAGQRAALRALGRALPLLSPGHSLRFVELPAGEDPDSLIRHGGRSEFAGRLDAARSLLDVLWDAGIGSKRTDTPERRADLKQRLHRHAAQINHRDVQVEYRRMLLDRYYDLVRSEWLKRRPGGNSSGSRPIVERAPPLPRRAAPLHRQLVLGMLVRAPALIDQLADEIVELDFTGEPDLDKLRWEILEVATRHPGLDREEFRQHLGQSGLGGVIGSVNSRLAVHLGFAAQRGDSPEVLRIGIMEVLQLMRAGDRSDLEAARQALASDETAEAWDRFQALKERELQDGPIGGIDA
jgi:DNA primase